MLPGRPFIMDRQNVRIVEVFGFQWKKNDSIGHVVETRLRDASISATQVLQKCFCNRVMDKHRN